jgi:elongator complex protein 3
MENILMALLDRLRETGELDYKHISKAFRARNKSLSAGLAPFAKKSFVPWYLGIKETDASRWAGWGIDPQTEAALLRALRVKPRRTASGVATITLMTKPWPCSNDCIYCPNDLRMPKSYLHGEPACQRAEQNGFDPYLQTASRLRMLEHMGHPTDKIELIILGGTWSEYPKGYQAWFIGEAFQALNDGCRAYGDASQALNDGCRAYGEAEKRRACRAWQASGDLNDCHADNGGASSNRADDGGASSNRADDGVASSNRADDGGASSNRADDGRAALLATLQRQVDDGDLSYNEAVSRLEALGANAGLGSLPQPPGQPLQPPPGQPLPRPAEQPLFASMGQDMGLPELLRRQTVNETAAHRVVGLSVETRPDLIDSESLAWLRQLGCTKIQMGVQSLDPKILRANGRKVALSDIENAFALLRLFGFKIQVHAMANLYGATPQGDMQDYQRLVTDSRYLPDEVKLYPCALVRGARLEKRFADGTWRPYSEQELVELLLADLRATPEYVRISRMIRDISSCDIMAGNKKTNLRQLVERRASAAEGALQKGALPEGALPEGALPEGGLQKGALPEGSLQEGALPEGALPEGGIKEIRFREISTNDAELGSLALQTSRYETCVSDERFLQWLTPEGRIVGFLRLSLPKPAALAAYAGVPIGLGEAMIREVHIYGRAARLNQPEGLRPPVATSVGEQEGAQHRGLGAKLIEAACDIARACGYSCINVISSVGTREYYRSLGFTDTGNRLYQRRSLA